MDKSNIIGRSKEFKDAFKEKCAAVQGEASTNPEDDFEFNIRSDKGRFLEDIFREMKRRKIKRVSMKDLVKIAGEEVLK